MTQTQVAEKKRLTFCLFSSGLFVLLWLKGFTVLNVNLRLPFTDRAGTVPRQKHTTFSCLGISNQLRSKLTLDGGSRLRQLDVTYSAVLKTQESPGWTQVALCLFQVKHARPRSICQAFFYPQHLFCCQEGPDFLHFRINLPEGGDNHTSPKHTRQAFLAAVVVPFSIPPF